MWSPARPGRTAATSCSTASYDLTRLDEAEIAELGIGRKFQKPTVFDSHTVDDNLELALKSDRRARADLVLAREPAASATASTSS